jgi:hypothetical protein
MSGTKDANLQLRYTSDAELTATVIYETEIFQTPLEGLAYEVYVPVVDTATDATLDVKIRASTASTVATTDSEIAGRTDLEQATGWYHIPFSTNKRTVEIELVVGGTSPDFSNVLVYITQAQQEYSRAKSFI